jgi:hypothetical protein
MEEVVVGILIFSFCEHGLFEKPAATFSNHARLNLSPLQAKVKKTMA